MAGYAQPPSAELEALKHSFNYLVNSIDTAALLSAALSRNLITERQRMECYVEADPYKKAETFLGHIQRAVNADCYNFYTFVHILQETRQTQIASHVRDELAHSFRSMPQPSTSCICSLESIVPETLVEELAELRIAFAKLLHNYEKQLRNRPEAQEEFVNFLSRLFPRAVGIQSFQSCFNILIEEVSLFNTFYLNRICAHSVFPEDICAATRQLVDEYEHKRQNFMTCATVSEFKQLFPATATSSKLHVEKVPIKLKLQNKWGNETLQNLKELVALFGVSGNYLHLSKVEDGCIAVTWLCSDSEVKQLKMAIFEAASSLQTMGVLQVFIEEEELVLECSETAVGSIELVPLSPPTRATEPKSVTVYLVHKTSIDYQCPLCYELFTEAHMEPFITDCGHLCCRSCYDHLLDSDKAECPLCREPNMLNSARCDKYLQRAVGDLEVRCSDYKEGCEWIGELRDLRDHLSPANGQCVCGIPCPFGCGKYNRKNEIKEHTRLCHNRMISCENCGYYNTFTVVTEKHYPICPSQPPIDCPNQHCPVKSIRQHQLEQHLNECSHQLVDCPSTGCSVQLPRDKMKLHTLEQHNLVLVETNQVTPSLPQYLYNETPIEFIIDDFTGKKEANKICFSSAFYTHDRGYKFRLQVYPNGHHTGSGSYLTVAAQLMRGEYDDELEWPFEGDIRVELLNWRADENHHSDRFPFNRHHDPNGRRSTRVIDQETAPAFGNPQFISHTELQQVSITNTGYLRNDCLKLRVNVGVYSTPLLHKTPEWQDSVIGTQSWAQFAISEYSKRKQLDNKYYSPPFTTSPQGYKLCLAVCANGAGSGKGSHLSIFTYIMNGQHDDQLQWPFTGTIIIELLNCKEDKRHYTKILSINTNDEFVRVTRGNYGRNIGFPQFISQFSLESYENVQYLYEDCIFVRVQATVHLI